VKGFILIWDRGEGIYLRHMALRCWQHEHVFLAGSEGITGSVVRPRQPHPVKICAGDVQKTLLAYLSDHLSGIKKKP